jgi:hypothetical protein
MYRPYHNVLLFMVGNPSRHLFVVGTKTALPRYQLYLLFPWACSDGDGLALPVKKERKKERKAKAKTRRKKEKEKKKEKGMSLPSSGKS